jgi:hypothetical protein
MTPKQIGHRAAAWGTPRDEIAGLDPLPSALEEAHAAYDKVMRRNALGVDPGGHMPRIPHLCERDVSKVCNCCSACGVACWTERFEGSEVRLRRSVIEVIESLKREITRRLGK